MRRLTAMLSSIALLVAFGSAACDSGGGGDDKKAKSKEAEKKGAMKEKKSKKAEKDGDKKQKEDTEVSKEDYVQASVQLACVDEHLGGSDKVDSKKVEADILGSFGMDQKAFVKAQNKYSGDEKLSKKVEKQLEECTKKDAKKHAGLMKEEDGDDGEGSKKGDKKEPAKPPATGKFEGTISGQSGFDQAKLTIRVEKDFDTRFSFKGKREGKGFNISGSGKVEKNGDVDLSASSGKNEIKLVGQVTSSKKEVNVKGKIWDKSFSANIDVK